MPGGDADFLKELGLMFLRASDKLREELQKEQESS
jgi:hypothetical protein